MIKASGDLERHRATASGGSTSAWPWVNGGWPPHPVKNAAWKTRLSFGNGPFFRCTSRYPPVTNPNSCRENPPNVKKIDVLYQLYQPPQKICTNQPIPPPKKKNINTPWTKEQKAHWKEWDPKPPRWYWASKPTPMQQGLPPIDDEKWRYQNTMLSPHTWSTVSPLII